MVNTDSAKTKLKLIWAEHIDLIQKDLWILMALRLKNKGNYLNSLCQTGHLFPVFCWQSYCTQILLQPASNGGYFVSLFCHWRMLSPDVYKKSVYLGSVALFLIGASKIHSEKPSRAFRYALSKPRLYQRFDFGITAVSLPNEVASDNSNSRVSSLSDEFATALSNFPLVDSCFHLDTTDNSL